MAVKLPRKVRHYVSCNDYKVIGSMLGHYVERPWLHVTRPAIVENLQNQKNWLTGLNVRTSATNSLPSVFFKSDTSYQRRGNRFENEGATFVMPSPSTGQP